MRDIDSTTFYGKFIDYATSFENRFYDYRMKTALDPKFKSQEQVLLKIDDYSLQKIGTWPIPRAEYAKMLDRLKHFGAKVVAFDIMYPEKSPTVDGVSGDQVFAEAIKNFQAEGNRTFLAYTISDESEEHLPEAPIEMLNDAVLTRSEGVELLSKKIARYTFPIEELVATESGLAFINSEDDTDGIFRQYQLIANVDTIYYGSLAFNAFEAFTDKKHTINIFKDSTGILEYETGEKLEIGSRGETKIRYIGAELQFPDIPLYDFLSADLNDPEMRKKIEGKMIFIGSTANGAHDLRPSPLDSKMPGVYSHMNVAHMLLHKYFFKNLNESLKYSLIFLFIGMLLFILVQRLGHAFLDAIVIIAVITGGYYADKTYFLPNGYELKLFYCFFCFLASYSWNTFILFYEANKEKKQIKGTFARYVAPTVVDQMLKNPEMLQVGGVKTDITCLFSDVRDFTSISEGLTATELSQMLNFYMGKMTDIVFETKGTLDKYIGDAVVALWGAPVPIGNHAQFAVEAAVQMMESMEGINEEFQKLGRPLFKVGIGLNSGECSVGNMGSSRIFSYTALGDNMNLGARLESLCKHYGAQILISEYTLSRLNESIKTRPIDRVIVKGKTTPVAIFEVIHGHHPMGRDPSLLQKFKKAHATFMEKDFEKALGILSELHEVLPEDKPIKRLMALCEKLLGDPLLAESEDFDVTKMTEK